MISGHINEKQKIFIYRKKVIALEIDALKKLKSINNSFDEAVIKLQIANQK